MVFLLGLPRSGTTLLQRLLGGHSAIHTVAEPWLMLPLSGLLSDRLVHTDYDSALATQALESFALELPGGRAEIAEGMRRFAIDLYASCRGAEGARYFLDKTPRYHYILPELIELFPDAHFIVLRRNPLDILASVAESWFGGDVNLALSDPSHHRDLTLGFRHLDEAAPLLGDRACTVRYESLVVDPEREVRRLCAFLDIDFEPAMLQYDPATRFKGSFGDDIGLPRHRAPNPASLDKWRETLLRRENIVASLAFLRGTPMESFRSTGQDPGALEREFESRIGRSRAEGGPASPGASGAEQPILPVAEPTASPNEENDNGDAVLLRLREANLRLRSIELSFDMVVRRVPSDAELSHWLARFEDGFFPWDLVWALVEGEERRATAGERDGAVRGLLRAAYRRFLLREASEEDQALWVAYIEAGSSPWALLELIAASEEAQTRREMIERERLRSVWLGFDVVVRRVPSDAELSHWLARFEDGFFPWDLVSALAGGEERRATAGERDEAVRALLRAAYRRYLFREASHDDLSAWVAHLEAGVSPWTLLESIASSEEADADAVLGQLSNTALAAYALEPLHGRGLSPAELIEWKHTLDSGQLDRTEFLLQAMRHHLRRTVAEQALLESLPDPQELTMMGTSEVLSPQIWDARAEEVKLERAALGARVAAETTPYQARGQTKVSVIASLYRGGKYIERFLEMIVSQTMGHDIELIIIDAQSPEHEADTIRHYQDAHPNIVYRRVDHRIGIYAAWNIGVELARGEYLTNANLDDLRASDSFERQAAVLDRHPWVDVVYQDFFYTLDDSLDFETVARFGFKSDLPMVTPANLMLYNSPHHAPMWRKSLHDEIGPFDEFLRSAGDYDFWMRCAARDKTFFKINHPHVAYFQNPTGMSTKPGGPGAEEGARLLRQHARSLVPPVLFADDHAIRSELELLCGAPLADAGPESFYDLAQRALECSWWSDGSTAEGSTP